ncbi:P-loop containing nucleoside triphosphate hydrolase protein [Gigaspora rosea]|uniref:Kinesin-like protein n=1 Tax=Gigaspora rosea TaxID=44941 RepID=A0A397W1T7_9GLOM|nr:P-loop containing nucleoside triphosphate hydrolase protein [Gigaspora rosea]
MDSSIKRSLTRIGSPQPLRAASDTLSTTNTLTPTPEPSKNQSSNTASNRQNVRVTVRVRPPNAVEMSRGETEIWEVDSAIGKVSLQPDFTERYRKQMSEYYYDEVFTGSDNKLLFERGVRETVSFFGNKGTVFAYGQTSSGKTFTGSESQPGVIPQAVDAVFEYIKENKEKEFLLRVSYMEIYNETVRDLLCPETDDLRIHEDKRRGVYVSPLKEVVVSTPKQVMKEILKGEANRHMSSTDWNERSSRSHTVFQMVVESTAKGSLPPRSSRFSTLGQKQSASVSLSVLNLIDLAGSEKAASSADRRKEGAFINKSGHIPYRDSKLTRILQNSLSGNARVAVICTISPSVINHEESQNTLKFASRIKKVVTRAQTNAVMDDKALLQKYRIEIEELKAKLERTNETNNKEKESELSQMLQQEKAKHEEEMMEAQLVRTALKERIDHLTKLILTNSSFSANAQQPTATRKPVVDHTSSGGQVSEFVQLESQIEAKNVTINLLKSDVESKNQMINKLTEQLKAANEKAEKSIRELNNRLKAKDEELKNLRNENRELKTVIEEQLGNEDDGNANGHSRSGSREYGELSKTIQRQRNIINGLEEEIKANKLIISNQKEMLHRAGLSQLQNNASTNRVNGRRMENDEYSTLTKENTRGNGSGNGKSLVLKNHCLIADEVILIFLLLAFSIFKIVD